MKNLFTALVLLAVCAPAGSSVALAASDACKSDAAVLCPGQTWNNGLGKCLQKNNAKLSEACRANVKKNKQEFSELKESCNDDIQKLCSDAKPGKSHLKACLRSHTDELSSSCKDELGASQG